MGNYKKIHIKNLILWNNNPRYGKDAISFENEKEIVSGLYKMNEYHMKNLATDIALNGLSPHDLIVVLPSATGLYQVYEGNRRISAIKTLFRPWYLDYKPSLQKSLQRLKNKNIQSSIIYCYVADSEEEAFEIVEKTHYGINKGIGRVPWGTLEKDKFRALTNQFNQTTIAYKLGKQYPDEFDDLIDDLKPTNVDRILEKKIIRECIETDKDYSGLDTLQLSLVRYILEEVKSITEQEERSIAYIFHNVSDIEKLLLPKVKDEKKRIYSASKKAKHEPKVLKPEEKPVVLKVSQDEIFHQFGTDYEILDNLVIDNNIDVSKIKISSQGKKKAIIKNSIFTKENPVGNYIIIFEYISQNKTIKKPFYINVSKPTITIKDTPKQLFQAEYSFEINISPVINKLINQLNTIDLEKYNLVVITSIRSLVEMTFKIVFHNQSVNMKAHLNDNIDLFKSLIIKDNSIQSKIIKETPLNRTELLNFIKSIDTNVLTSKLNSMTHSPGLYLNSNDILDVANKIVVHLLIFSTIILK